ncbi:hypothetical protein [Absidia glauca]|uniref:Ndc10 domain-containing protein n=1 Tax=Absidia glauca TaxID=4829 RepID=A0A168NXG3_ABSGL|nr:hypothetical protein [Absidia glauca]
MATLQSVIIKLAVSILVAYVWNGRPTGELVTLGIFLTHVPSRQCTRNTQQASLLLDCFRDTDYEIQG